MKDFKMSPKPKLEKLADFPMGSSQPSWTITEGNAAWRVFKPVINQETCVGCHICYYVCPDGAIHKEAEKTFLIDYDFCKGCGICAYECKLKAITMVKEEK